MLLAPKFWPVGLWIAAGALAVLVLHAIGLGVHLALTGADSGYGEHGIGTLVPAVIVLGLGVFSAVGMYRGPAQDVAAMGRLFLLAFVVIAAVLVGLGLPLYLAEREVQ